LPQGQSLGEHVDLNLRAQGLQFGDGLKSDWFEEGFFSRADFGVLLFGLKEMFKGFGFVGVGLFMVGFVFLVLLADALGPRLILPFDGGPTGHMGGIGGW
jgi:hypothetical protein